MLPNLNWRVEKVPAYAEIAGENIAIGKSALVRDRDNRILDVVSDDWNPVRTKMRLTSSMSSYGW